MSLQTPMLEGDECCGAVRKNLVRKSAVAQAFSRAANSYDHVAELQRYSGEQLCQRFAPPLLDTKPYRVLDAGCGTGYFSRYWRDRQAEVIALDLASGMIATAQRQQSAHQYLCADIEQIPLADQSVDLVYSNLAIQWCSSLSQALSELYRVTHPGGYVFFSTLMTGSLLELEETWRLVDPYTHVNRFLSLPQIEQACAPYSGRVTLQSQSYTQYFSDLRAVMHSLKGIGATHVHQGRHSGLGGKQRLQRLTEKYPRHPQGLPLTYQLLFGRIARE